MDYFVSEMLPALIGGFVAGYVFHVLGRMYTASKNKRR